MITIIHLDGVATTKGTNLPGRSLYAMGWIKPHYPVPAIPIDVDFHPDYVLVTEFHDHKTEDGITTYNIIYVEYPL